MKALRLDKKLLTVLLVLVFQVGCFHLANAQKAPNNSKVSKALLDLASENQSAQLSNTIAPSSKSLRKSTKPTDIFQSGLSDMVQVYDGYVVFDAIVATSANELMGELSAKGCKKLSSFGGVVSGLMPLSSIAEMEQVSSLKFLKAAFKPHKNVGLTTSQADEAQLSDEAKSLFNVNGAGVKIGIISDSYDNLLGADATIVSGDLPGAANPNGFTTEVQVLEDLPSGGSDEGRAMAELVHDVAPGSELAFHTAFLGTADFANGIIELAQNDCDVIVDDIIYFAEPMFQDGIIGQATDIVKDAGVSYFSSAGNQLDASYEAPFRDGGTYELADAFSGFSLGDYIMHDFDEGPGVDIFQEIQFPATGGSLTLALQWAEPAASVCAGCPGATSDLDFFLVLAEDTGAVFFNLSGLDFNVGADPFELLGISAGGAVTAYLAIGKVPDGTPNPEMIKYVSYADNLVTEYVGRSSTSYGHANANGAISVGAVRYDRTPEFGVNPPLREVFSSSGGVPTFFDIQGNPINELRLKPEISAVQGTNTTFFGFDYEGDGFPNFFGTSASAPHAAAVAALMLEANGMDLTPDEIEEAMTSTAIDIAPTNPLTKTPPAGTDAKFDFDTGFGLLVATEAIASTLDVPTVTSFTVIDAKTGEMLTKLEDGDQIDLAMLENPINIIAETSNGTGEIKSVNLSLKGATYAGSYDTKAPYALIRNDKWLPWVGEYNLTATPYTKAKGRRNHLKGIELSIDFTVVNSAKVEQYVIVNGDTGEDIGILGDTLNLAELPTKNIDIRAEINTPNASRVVTILSGKMYVSSIDTQAPYTLAQSWNRNKYTYLFNRTGSYKLTSTVYVGKGWFGFAGEKTEFELEVIDEASAVANARQANGLLITDNEAIGEPSLEVYPNVSQGIVNIQLNAIDAKQTTQLSIFNIAGEEVLTRPQLSSGTIQLDLTSYNRGMYFAKIAAGNKILIQKFILN
ncbi:T9SS type A sorting domain-containing protein [Flammeovirgaceae bacterium SG7u.111]|nr:T9SS type A sorting domain-containing protein [Flammeovirgaceae bacterium SG7u.132]WPO37313.1 T9SS type A sorting domain-containing protein [Flammeovirgaceae bacterium SG7u.111]